jgi:tetratricopeptide (TPR) repeat protein
LALAAACGRATVPDPERWACDPEADQALRRGDTEAGIRLHETFLQAHPDNPLALYHLGYAYGLTGDHRREVAYYEKARDLGYTEGAFLFNLGMAYGETGQHRKAAEALEQAVDQDPDNADYRAGLALALEQSGEVDAAADALREAIRLDPNHPWARDLLQRLENRGW